MSKKVAEGVARKEAERLVREEPERLAREETERLAREEERAFSMRGSGAINQRWWCGVDVGVPLTPVDPLVTVRSSRVKHGPTGRAGVQSGQRFPAALPCGDSSR